MRHGHNGQFRYISLLFDWNDMQDLFRFLLLNLSYVRTDFQPIALNLPVPNSGFFYSSNQHRVEDLGPRWQSDGHAMGKSSCSFGL